MTPYVTKNMNILPSGISSASFSFQNIADNVIYIMQKRAKIYIQNGTSNVTQWESGVNNFNWSLNNDMFTFKKYDNQMVFLHFFFFFFCNFSET